MKFKLLILTILFTVGIFGQSDRLKTGNLTTGDSTIIFFAGDKAWIEIQLVDSLTTDDTCVVEIVNEITGEWMIVGVKDQQEEEFVSVLTPGVSSEGKIYIVWLMYPRKIRLRKTDVHNISEKIYYSIKSKGLVE